MNKKNLRENSNGIVDVSWKIWRVLWEIKRKMWETYRKSNSCRHGITKVIWGKREKNEMLPYCIFGTYFLYHQKLAKNPVVHLLYIRISQRPIIFAFRLQSPSNSIVSVFHFAPLTSLGYYFFSSCHKKK